MKRQMYARLGRMIVFVTLLVSLTPLMTLGGTIYYQVSRLYKAKI